MNSRPAFRSAISGHADKRIVENSRHVIISRSITELRPWRSLGGRGALLSANSTEALFSLIEEHWCRVRRQGGRATGATS
jgi:hypothetical protein